MVNKKSIFSVGEDVKEGLFYVLVVGIVYGILGGIVYGILGGLVGGILWFFQSQWEVEDAKKEEEGVR